jgi:hypothetical protein
MTREERRTAGGQDEPPCPLLQPGERIVWSGRPIVLRTVRPWQVLIFFAGLVLAIYGVSSILELVAANRSFRGTAFEGFMVRPSRAMVTPGMISLLGLVIASYLPIQLILAAGTRYDLSERRVIEKCPGLLGPRHVAATIAPSGEVAVKQTGRSYSLAFSAFTTVPAAPFPFVFHNLSEPSFRQALAHIRAVTGRGEAEAPGTTKEVIA